jgi:hypothetical protein
VVSTWVNIQPNWILRGNRKITTWTYFSGKSKMVDEIHRSYLARVRVGHTIHYLYTMATLARTAFNASRPFVRPCIASSSRLTRTYATESTVTASEIYGTSKGPEGAIMKKYTGKGFPAIPVSLLLTMECLS